MIFRPSQKLSAKIKTGTLRVRPPDSNVFADWSAHLFIADRNQYILVSNTKSLYSLVMPGKGITTTNQFIEEALRGIRDCMTADDLEAAFQQCVAPVAATVTFAKALNRSVTGSMNELIFQAIVCLVEEKMALRDVSSRLNEVLISSLPGPGGGGYGRPRDVFRAMLDSV